MDSLPFKNRAGIKDFGDTSHNEYLYLVKFSNVSSWELGFVKLGIEL